MKSDFLIVHKKILPDYLDKVIEARKLLENKECSTVKEAVKQVGISRNTYYKYKDYVIKDIYEFNYIDDEVIFVIDKIYELLRNNIKIKNLWNIKGILIS